MGVVTICRVLNGRCIKATRGIGVLEGELGQRIGEWLAEAYLRTAIKNVAETPIESP